MIYMIIPIVFTIKSKKRNGIVISAFVFVVTGVFYWIINSYLVAAYFTPLFDVSIIKYFLQGKFVEFFYLTISRINEIVPELIEFCAQAFQIGLTAGTTYVISIIITLAMVIWLIGGKQKEDRVIWIFPITTLSLIVAIVLFLGKVNEGGRHLLPIVIAGLLLCSVEVEHFTMKIGNVIIVMVLGIFLVRGSLVPTDYDVPQKDENLKINLEYWQTAFIDKGIILTDDMGYENTILWVLGDWNDTGFHMLDHKELYALPRGMGINCCTPEYVYNNWMLLKSRYIATIPEGNVDIACAMNGMIEIGRTSQIVIYQRY